MNQVASQSKHMTAECKETMMEVQYFMARDFSLDPRLYSGIMPIFEFNSIPIGIPIPIGFSIGFSIPIGIKIPIKSPIPIGILPIPIGILPIPIGLSIPIGIPILFLFYFQLAELMPRIFAK